MKLSNNKNNTVINEQEQITKTTLVDAKDKDLIKIKRIVSANNTQDLETHLTSTSNTTQFKINLHELKKNLIFIHGKSQLRLYSDSPNDFVHNDDVIPFDESEYEKILTSSTTGTNLHLRSTNSTSSSLASNNYKQPKKFDSTSQIPDHLQP